MTSRELDHAWVLGYPGIKFITFANGVVRVLADYYAREGRTMLWEVVNPSDSYTLEAESFEVAVVADLVMWEGRYALQALSPETPHMPIMLFRSVYDWVRETFGKTVEELTRETDRAKVAEACASVLLSRNAEDRKKYDGLTEDEKLALHDKLRGSMNDIGRRAWAMAAGLRNWKVRSCGKS